MVAPTLTQVKLSEEFKTALEKLMTVAIDEGNRLNSLTINGEKVKLQLLEDVEVSADGNLIVYDPL